MDLFQPDKLAHIFVFAVFYILLILSFRSFGTPSVVANNPVLFALLTCLFVAGSTELLQEYVVPMRTASVWDFIANMAGCFAGWGVTKMVKGKR
jgi:VanZ family protein